MAGYPLAHVFPLYQELTSRDLLQRRIIGNDGSTSWSDTPLIRAAREGGICILDGIHSLDVHALSSLRRLLQDGVINLPNGETVTIGLPTLFDEIHLIYFRSKIVIPRGCSWTSA
jgi:von Willebrand factor A domain-containing protein 8